MSEYRRRLVELAARYGRRVETTAKNHCKLTKPGRPMVIAPYSTGDHRALKNTEALLKRMDGEEKS